MIVEVGKLYKQRNGIVVGPLEHYTPNTNTFSEFVFSCVGSNDYYNHSTAEDTFSHRRIWRKDGLFNTSEFQSPCDIVSEFVGPFLEKMPTTTKTSSIPAALSAIKIKKKVYALGADGTRLAEVNEHASIYVLLHAARFEIEI